MKLAYAIHQIIMGSEVVEPNSVFKTDRFVELEAMGAVREPTKDETGLYKLAQADEKVEEKPAEPKKVNDGAATRADLEARAAAAKVDFRANISDEKLLERILEAEAQATAAAGDADLKTPLV